ncbi:MAG: phosphoribosylformylglycinamidine synthase I [Bacteroidetes bacterium QH_6_64_77]|nr:MAG: phosphoribosylformylglycinamidine synthase I [Bacteroidetes bacterium QH_6_64_77]
MSASFGIVVFPGSNCDHDAYHVTKHVFDQDARFIWHEEESLGDVDVVIVPGGFSYGDYLRSGAIARFSPIMQDVVRFAEEGGLVFGICNGFQILCEAGLLPGTLMRNDSLRFICKETTLRVENADTPFTNGSVHGIAGLVNDAGTVCGLMPHPERCVESLLGGDDGRLIFESLLNHVSAVAA